jgi:ABC-type histidine transport system ATPase subunit
MLNGFCSIVFQFRKFFNLFDVNESTGKHEKNQYQYVRKQMGKNFLIWKFCSENTQKKNVRESPYRVLEKSEYYAIFKLIRYSTI